MTAMDDERWVGTGTVEWAAQRVIEQHREPPNEARLTGTCAQCPPGHPEACDLLYWAEEAISGVPHPRS